MGGFYPIEVGPGSRSKKTGVLAAPRAGQDFPGKPSVRPFFTVVLQGFFGDCLLEGFDVFELNLDMSNDIELGAVITLLFCMMIRGAEGGKPG